MPGGNPQFDNLPLLLNGKKCFVGVVSMASYSIVSPSMCKSLGINVLFSSNTVQLADGTKRRSLGRSEIIQVRVKDKSFSHVFEVMDIQGSASRCGIGLMGLPCTFPQDEQLEMKDNEVSNKLKI